MGRTIAFASLIAVLSLAAFGQNTPQWQIDAGRKTAFEVASVKSSKPDAIQTTNFSLDASDSFQNVRTNERPNGRLSAIAPLQSYIRFAYKLHISTVAQLNEMIAHLPKWVSTDNFEIEARAPGNPTKDQMRLMMQALLAERFQLAVHFETRDTSVLAMTLAKPGKTGPGLRPHAYGPSCDAAPSPEIYPSICNIFGWKFSTDTRGSSAPLLLPRTGGARDITTALIADYLPSWGSLDRPVIDRTGLTGKFDFTIKWTPDTTSVGGGSAVPKKGSSLPVRPPAAQSPGPDADGPTFIQALREQAGLKLESSRAPVQTLIIDRVERPSEN